MNGTVKFFDESKGFGFIVGEDGKDYFVHKTALEEGIRLKENDVVTFDVEKGDRGPKAVNVKLASWFWELIIKFNKFYYLFFIFILIV